MQQYTVYLHLQTDVHVSRGISTYHQELISLYLQYLALLRLQRIKLLLNVYVISIQHKDLLVTLSFSTNFQIAHLTYN